MMNPAWLLEYLAIYPPFGNQLDIFPEWVYVLHFERLLSGHAGHYIGTTRDLPGRMEEHRLGRGSCLMAAVGEAGIAWQVAVAFPGGRKLEREIKNYHNARAICPICRPAYVAEKRVRGMAHYFTQKETKGVACSNI